MSTEKMNSYERALAALKREEPDRVPVSGLTCSVANRWINAYMDEFAQSGELLAKGIAQAHDKFHFDLVDITPDVGWLPQGFGCKIKYQHTYDYTPSIEEFAVKNVEDWEKLETFDPEKPGTRTSEILKEIDILHKHWGNEVMFAIESFSPLTTATHIRKMDDTFMDMIMNPELLHKGLKTITDQWIETTRLAIEHGANAVFMLCTRSTRELLTLQQYLEFGWQYENRFMHEIKRLYPGIPSLLHACGDEPFFEILMNHDVDGVNWYDRRPAVSGVSNITLDLRNAKELYGNKTCLIGGIDQNRTAVMGDPIDIMAEARDAIYSAAKGGGFILCSGCDLPNQMSEEAVMAMWKAAEKWGRYPLKWAE